MGLPVKALMRNLNLLSVEVIKTNRLFSALQCAMLDSGLQFLAAGTGFNMGRASQGSGLRADTLSA